MIDVQESREAAEAYAKRWGFSFPVLLDGDGKVTASFAPEGVLPDLPRENVPIASNLLIDGKGIIRFYSLLDTTKFDAKLVALTARLRELLAAAATPGTGRAGLAAEPAGEMARAGCRRGCGDVASWGAPPRSMRQEP